MNKGIIAIIIAALVILIGGSVWYTQRPSRAVEAAVEQLAAAKTANYRLQLQLENVAASQQLLGEQGSVEFTAVGAFAREENNGQDSPARSALQADIVLLTKTESVSVAVEGEVRFVGNKLYFHITKLPPLYALLNQLKGQWFEIPRGEEMATPPPVTDEDHFQAIKRVGRETIDGESAVKYEAVAKEAAVVGMMDSVAEVLATRLTAQQLGSLRQSVDEAGEVPVELWISPWSNELRQLRANVTVPGGNTMHFTLNITDTGAPVTITVPESATPLSDFVQAARAAALPVPTTLPATPSPSVAP